LIGNFRSEIKARLNENESAQNKRCAPTNAHTLSLSLSLSVKENEKTKATTLKEQQKLS